MTLNLNTDRNKATSDFNPEDRFVKVAGELADVSILPNRDMTRARLDLHVHPLTEVVRAGERQTEPGDFKNGIHVSFDYGAWDAAKKEAKGPKKDDVWFEAIIEAFETAGFDTADLGTDLLGRVGDAIEFEERVIERKNKSGDTYEVNARDPETRDLLPPTNADDEDIVFDEETKYWSDGAVFAKQTAVYTNLLPAVSDGESAAKPAGKKASKAKASKPAKAADAGARAKALFEANADDYDAFKEAALADPAINGDSALRNSIIVGDYEAA